jgi:phosphatidylglycerophosphate synthase
MRILLGTYWTEAKQAKAGFTSSGDNGFIMGRLLRPLSFLVTPLFVRSGASANQITLLAGTTGVAALICVAIGTTVAWAIGAGLFLVYVLFDAVDGNVARVRNSASYLGKFLDGVVDTFVIAPVVLVLGWGSYQSGSDPAWLAVGAVAAFLHLFGFYAMTRYSFHREWLRIDAMEGRASVDPTTFATPPRRRRIPGGLILDATIVALFASIYPAAREASLAILAALILTWSTLTIRAEFLAAMATLNTWRQSRHATGYSAEQKAIASDDTEQVST